jgi:teichuronic acid biosynthesis glycosyltransferase TuaH
VSQGPSVLVLSTAEWSAPLWTNKQFIARELAREFDVTYVNSLGLRRPELSRRDVGRLVNRLREGVSNSGRQFAEGGVRVVSPLVVPLHSIRLAVEPANRGLLRRAVRPWLSRSPRLLWAFSPVTYGLERYATATVYHAVDLLQHFPRVDSAAVTRGEKTLVGAGALTIASSTTIAAHLTELGARPLLWENVAEVELFAQATVGRTPGEGHVVFAGNLTEHKVDFSLLSALVTRLPVTLHVAGPAAEGGGSSAAAEELLRHPRVVYHGVLGKADLADLIAGCRVGLIPYLVNDYTRGVFPMKVYEYIAGGCTVVSTPIEALRDPPPHVSVAAGVAFIDAVREAITRPEPSSRRTERIDSAMDNGWQRRGADARDLARTLLEGNKPGPADDGPQR